ENAQKAKRILVDRIWPRGVSKEDANLDRWLKEIAPSDELRKWFGHDADKWEEFKSRYIDHLKKDKKAKEAVKTLKDQAQKGTVLLLYAAKDEKHNNAVVLREYLTS